MSDQFKRQAEELTPHSYISRSEVPLTKGIEDALIDAYNKGVEDGDNAVVSAEYGESAGYVAAAINVATARIRALKLPKE